MKKNGEFLKKYTLNNYISDLYWKMYVEKLFVQN